MGDLMRFAEREHEMAISNLKHAHVLNSCQLNQMLLVMMLLIWYKNKKFYDSLKNESLY